MHSQHKITFYSSLLLELSARIFSSLEIYIILRVFTPEVSGWDCVLILAFSSLFSNLIFFFPMQLGAREGGLALAVDGLHMSPALGVYVGLITRLRELLWIVIGMVLIKVGNRKPGDRLLPNVKASSGIPITLPTSGYSVYRSVNTFLIIYYIHRKPLSLHPKMKCGKI